MLMNLRHFWNFVIMFYRSVFTAVRIWQFCLAYHQKTSLVYNVRRTLPLGSSSAAPGGDQQTLLAYLNSYIGCPLSGASSSRSPALPTKPYLLPSLPTSIHPLNITLYLVPCVRLTLNCCSFPVFAHVSVLAA